MIEPGLFFVKKKITIHIIIWVFVPRDYFCDTAKLFSHYIYTVKPSFQRTSFQRIFVSTNFGFGPFFLLIKTFSFQRILYLNRVTTNNEFFGRILIVNTNRVTTNSRDFQPIKKIHSNYDPFLFDSFY